MGFAENISILSSVSDPKADYIGTEPWKPKEALEKGREITDKADIFAYGLTLWEMMTLAMPHLEMLEDEDDNEEEVEGETLCGHSSVVRKQKPPNVTLLTFAFKLS